MESLRTTVPYLHKWPQQRIKYSGVNHFADDTNLLLSDISLKKMNKHINHNLKLLNIWLRANIISLNASKTEIILFRPKSQSNITKHLNFRISGQYIGRISEVKYLGLILNEFLSWSTYYTLLKKKLNRAIGLLSKVRHFTSPIKKVSGKLPLRKIAPRSGSGFEITLCLTLI